MKKFFLLAATAMLLSSSVAFATGGEKTNQKAKLRLKKNVQSLVRHVVIKTNAIKVN